jgi:hypothetical protein
VPPLPPVPSVLKVFMTGFIDNLRVQNWGNNLHWVYSGGPPGNSECAAIAQAFSQIWTVHMAPECPSPTQLSKVTVTDLTSDTAGQGEWLGSVVGTRGDDSIPANACVLISYPSQLRYRGGHPRQYLFVGGNADLQGAGNWSDAFTLEAQNHWIAFLSDAGIINQGTTRLTQFCTVSYVDKETNPVPPFRRSTPLVINLNFSQAVASKQMASQRSRIGRARRNATGQP